MDRTMLQRTKQVGEKGAELRGLNGYDFWLGIRKNYGAEAPGNEIRRYVRR